MLKARKISRKPKIYGWSKNLILGVLAVFMAVAMIWGWVSMAKMAIVEIEADPNNRLKNAVQVMVGNINTLHDEYEAGKLSYDDARAMAIRMVSNGVWDCGRQGFWALEYDGQLLAKVENGDTSAKPGDNIWGEKDADGQLIEQSIINMAKAGGGFYEFRIENQAVNKSYMTYALITEFDFVVDATYDLDGLKQYSEGYLSQMTIFLLFMLVPFVILVLIVFKLLKYLSRKMGLKK